MAKQGSGGLAAFAQLTPINVDFGGVFREQEQKATAFAEQERARLEDQRKRNEDLARQAGVDISNLQQVITGVQSIDQANYLLIQNTQKRIGDWYRKARENPRLLQDPIFQMELQNLNKTPERLAQSQNKMTEYATQLSQGLANGSASDWNRQQSEELSAFFGAIDPNTGKMSPNVMFMPDQMGNTVAIGRKSNGDLFRTNVVDVINGYDFNEIIPTVDAQKDMLELADGLGKEEESRVRGGFIETIQSFDSKRDQVKEMIRARLGTAENPTAYAKSVWADELNESSRNLTEQDIRKMEDHLIGLVESNYDQFTRKKQVGSFGRRTFGQQRDVQESFFLYDLSFRGGQGDASALNEINSKLVVNDREGKPIRGARVEQTANAFVLVSGSEGEERIIDQIQKSLPQDEINIWFANKIRGTERSNETRQLYEQGKSQAQGVVPEVRRPGEIGEQRVVSTLDFRAAKPDFQNLSVGDFVDAFNENFGRKNVDIDQREEFKARKVRFRDIIEITPPAGKGRAVRFEYDGDVIPPDVIDEIEKFVDEKSQKRELRFIPPTQTEETTPASGVNWN